MGHPLSFPLLNILNLATILTYKRLYEGFDPRNFSKLKALVNGDDACFLVSKDFKIENYEFICGEVGFHLNPTKCLLSEKVGSLNSRRFIVDDNGTRACPHVPISIIEGKSYTLNFDEITILPEKVRYRSISRYIKNRPWLKKSIRPWGVPRHLGGLGIPLSVPTLTPFQRTACYYLKKCNLTCDSKLMPVFQYTKTRISILNSVSYLSQKMKNKKQKYRYDMSQKEYSNVLRNEGHRTWTLKKSILDDELFTDTILRKESKSDILQDRSLSFLSFM
jgi:hypothetical protein